MSERLWYYMQNGQQAGPVPESQLKALLQAGTLARDALVWSDLLTAWTPAAQVLELSAPTGDRQWHYLQGNVQAGPVPDSELKRLLGAGTVTPQTLVWTAGMENWAPLSAVPDLVAPESRAAAAAAQPALVAVGPGSGLLTPSEVVLLYADQFAGEGGMLKGGNWTSVINGAKVGYMDLTASLLAAALLANEQAGVVQIRMQPKKAMLGLKTVNAAMVDFVQEGSAWPEGTFEWMVVEGMRGQQGREVTNLFTGMLLMDSTYPHTLAANIVLVNLAKRALLASEEKKKLLVTSVTYTVTDQTRAAMAACPPDPVRQLLDKCRQGRPDIWQGLVDAAKAAIGNRTEYND